MGPKATIKIGFPGHFKQVTVRLPKGEPPPWPPNHPFVVATKPHPRTEAADKVTGRAQYTSDIRRPGMLVARILRSTKAAGKVVGIDLSRAKAHPGVRAAVALPVKFVRYVGQELAAVAADTEQIAEDALRLITVDIVPLRFVTHLEDAIKPNAVKVYPGRDNKRASRANGWSKGDVAAGFKAADKVVEASFRTHVQTHSCLETHMMAAEWKGDELTVWASTQGTFSVRDELAKVLGLPKAKVRVITEHMGAGFGSKFGARVEGLLAATLSKMSKRPVRVVVKRKGEHLSCGHRPGSLQKLKFGVTKDGTLTAMQLEALGEPGVGGGGGTSRPFTRIYDCKNKLIAEHDVFTNTGAGRAFRAPGHPPGCFALEQMIDIAAEAVGLDPIDFRLKNDSHPVRRAQLALGAKRIGWERRNKQPGGGSGDLRRGIGVASGLWYNTGRAGSELELRLHDDGSVELLSGAQDIGTGIRTILGQVVAEELALPLSAVTVRIGDTNYPWGPGSGGSKTTPCLAPVARAVAWQAKQKLFAEARRQLRVPKSTPLTLANGNVSAGTTSVSVKRLLKALPGSTLSVKHEREGNYAAYSEIIAGVQFADVEVDIGTGVIRVKKIVAVQDCGIVLNPLTARNQVNGGVIQGVSFALFEERIIDSRNGAMVNPNLEQYKIAGALDVPEIDVVLFDVNAGSNCTNALGIGEPVTVPTAAAIGNAVYNAVGVRVTELPMTPAVVLAALSRGGKRR